MHSVTTLAVISTHWIDIALMISAMFKLQLTFLQLHWTTGALHNEGNLIYVCSIMDNYSSLNSETKDFFHALKIFNDQ